MRFMMYIFQLFGFENSSFEDYDHQVKVKQSIAASMDEGIFRTKQNLEHYWAGKQQTDDMVHFNHHGSLPRVVTSTRKDSKSIWQ